MYLFNSCFWVIQIKYRSGISGPYVSSSFSFLRKLPTVFHSTCTNLQYHTSVPFSLHSPQHVFLIFLITPILTGMISFDLKFWFKFSEWLVTLSTFSCACRSPVSLLWKNFYSGHLPILNRASSLFWRLSYMSYVYIFNISPRWLYHLQTSPIQ